MKDCVFCDIVAGKAPAQIVYEDENYLAILDKYPQSRGHMQLIPKLHYEWVYEIPRMSKFFDIAQKIIRVIIPLLGADHVTLATFGHEIHHAHLWIVPHYGRGMKVLEEFGKNVTENDENLADKLKSAINAKFKNLDSK